MLSGANRGAAQLTASIFGLIGLLATLSSGSVIGVVLVFVGPTLAVTIHELGHALAAWRLGMNVQAITVGPASLRFHPMRLDRSDRFFGADVGGHVAFDDTGKRYLTRTTHRLIILAGPCANLAVAALAYALASVASDDVVVRVLVGFAFTNFAAFIASAWPHKYNDGIGNDGLQFLRTFDTGRRKDWRFTKPKRSPWQAP